MSLSPWNLLSEHERLILAPKLTDETDQRLEAAGERFRHLVCEEALRHITSPRTLQDRILTAQNFMLQAGAFGNSALWQQIASFKGFRRSHLEVTVKSRDEFLRVLAGSGFVVNCEPFWSIHKFDSARAITEYSQEPSLHFANDRADENGYGPNYFFVHWDRTSCWFKESRWPIKRWPGARAVERLTAAIQHRFGCACPVEVSSYVKSKSVDQHT